MTLRVIDDTSLDKDLYVFDEFGRCALRGVGALRRIGKATRFSRSQFRGNGINFMPSVTAALSVSNTVISDNADHGIVMRPSGTSRYDGVFTGVKAFRNSTSGIAQLLGPGGSCGATQDIATVYGTVFRWHVLSLCGDKGRR